MDSTNRPLKIGPYSLEARLGGGMGTVYRAYDDRLDRRVALKQIQPERADDPQIRQRFLREACAAARLDHPNLVHIHDILETPEGDWIVMELVEGRSLARLVERGPLELRLTVHLALEIAAGLATMHGAGIVHRDLKAENVMMAREGTVKVLDFGLAKPLEAGADDDLTGDGQLVGTPRTMSPEQVQGRPVDPRSDLFSFGILVYELSTGVSPFDGPSIPAILASICHRPHQPIRELVPDAPRELSDLVDQLLAKRPRRRPQSAAEVICRLQQIADAFEQRTVAELSTPVDSAPILAHGEFQEKVERPDEPTTFVGREREIAILDGSWQAACEGIGQTVLLAGAPGIGKTRLLRAFRDRLGGAEPGAPAPRWITAEGSPQAPRVPFRPLGGLLRHLLEIDTDAAAEQQLAALEETLTEHDFPLLETVPLFASLLGVGGPERQVPGGDQLRRAAVEAVPALILEMAERRPMVVAFEDLQWLDSATLDLIGCLIDQASASALLLLLTCRSDFRSPWDSRARMTLLSLGPLSDSETSEPVDR